jgi:hypothetical protein
MPEVMILAIGLTQPVKNLAIHGRRCSFMTTSAIPLNAAVQINVHDQILLAEIIGYGSDGPGSVVAKIQQGLRQSDCGPIWERRAQTANSAVA